MKTPWISTTNIRNVTIVSEVRIVEHLISSGGVVYRKVLGETQVVVCHRKNPILWCLPKGTPILGETLEETALREVFEETGLSVVIDTGLGSIDYSFSNRYDKTYYKKKVHFYLMHPLGGTLADHDTEFDDVYWLPFEKALELMTYPNEVGVVEKAIAKLQPGPIL